MTMKVSFEDPAATADFNLVVRADKEPMKPGSDRALGSKLYNEMKAKGVKDAVIQLPYMDANRVAQIADGFLRESYTFTKYKTTPQAKGPESLTVITAASKKAAAAFAPLRTTTESAFWASDLVNEPANVLNPKTYADRVKAELEPLGIKVRVIENDEMKKLGMGAITAVGQGSKTPPRMIVLEYDGTNGEEKRPLALVGKGITFDSGGISLKPGSGMGDMTMDMAGSAAVAGAIRALAARGSKSHVVGIMALAENMPDQNSVRPGDIVKSMSGKTIFIGNTDAEGRLVLCDALTLVQNLEKLDPRMAGLDPHTVIDFATLTGAVVAALGKEFAGAFTNSDKLMEEFNKASAVSGEKTWRMPLMETDAFEKAVKNTPHADLTNNPGPPGASTAAAYLYEFIENNRSFMHIDMAGTGIPNSERKGWGVFLLDQLVRQFYEVKAVANENSCKPAAVRKQQPKLG